MKRSFILSILLLIGSILYAMDNGLANDSLTWNKIIKKGYTIHYTTGDATQVKQLESYLQSGIDHIRKFFQHSFRDTFNVYIFPDRASLDKQWQKDWNDPTFKSECWMIASGVGHRLDILSPNTWQEQACDHNGSDSTEIRQVIWHELVHVFHGQYNPDHTFSYIEKLDWLVEGTATFVSGQLDNRRIARIRQMILENNAPSSLDNFWKGPERYGLSGSIVAFLDRKYGRQKLFELLQHTNKKNTLVALTITETQLLADWQNSFK